MWAVRMFNDWKACRNQRVVEHPELEISPIRCELVEMTVDELCYSLSRFVLEVRNRKGLEYSAQTLYEAVISLQMFLSTKGREMKFLQDEAFLTFRNTMDARMKELTASGTRAPKKQASVIAEDDEERMWQTGILGSDNPTKLVETLLYKIGLHFALRAGSEHRQLRYPNSQIVLLEDNDGRRFLRYTEDVSKNNQGGLKHRRIEPKTVDAFEDVGKPESCIVKLFEKYIAHRPTTPKCSTAFYLRPLMKPDGEIWYSCQPQGRHQLEKTVNRLCQKAGLKGHYTNHSLRATAASRLYNLNFDEQLICETTGHRSSAVRSYKRTSDGQKKAISDALSLGQRPAPATSTSVGNCDREDATAPLTDSAGRVHVGGPGINVTVNVNLDKQAMV